MHTLDIRKLVRVQLGEDQLFGQAQAVIAVAVKTVGVQTAEVANAGWPGRSTVEELVHPLAAQGHLAADRLSFAKLESGDREAGRVTTGFCPAIVFMASTASSMNFFSVIALPTPMLITIFRSRGTRGYWSARAWPQGRERSPGNNAPSAGAWGPFGPFGFVLRLLCVFFALFMERPCCDTSTRGRSAYRVINGFLLCGGAMPRTFLLLSWDHFGVGRPGRRDHSGGSPAFSPLAKAFLHAIIQEAGADPGWLAAGLAEQRGDIALRDRHLHGKPATLRVPLAAADVPVNPVHAFHDHAVRAVARTRRGPRGV